MSIRNLMTPEPVTVRANATVEDIANLLMKHRIVGVPAVDEERRLLGTVPAADLIQRGADERLEPRESVWKAQVMATDVHSRIDLLGHLKELRNPLERGASRRAP